MTTTPRVLLVDDDASLRGLIGSFLSEQGFTVFEAEDSIAMRRVLAESQIDIIVLDVMMPGEDGLSVARSLYERNDLGIIMVSALGSETDRIIGLEVGADDYLPKPISPRELLARIRALNRRRKSDNTAEGRGVSYKFEGWNLDVVRRMLRDPEGVIVSLSDGEFGLLLVLVERPQRVLTRHQLLELARGHDSEAFDRAIDTQISRLRRKLATRAGEELIRTIRNEGYMFMPAVARI